MLVALGISGPESNSAYMGRWAGPSCPVASDANGCAQRLNQLMPGSLLSAAAA
jgi:hypothetical protein